jgi:hypothetical protein
MLKICDLPIQKILQDNLFTFLNIIFTNSKQKIISKLTIKVFHNITHSFTSSFKTNFSYPCNILLYLIIVIPIFFQCVNKFTNIRMSNISLLCSYFCAMLLHYLYSLAFQVKNSVKKHSKIRYCKNFLNLLFHLNWYYLSTPFQKLQNI